MTGLVILRCTDQALVDAFTAAFDDPAVSVRLAAADGLFRLRRYADGLPALIAALEHPLPVTHGRAANVLDSQPPSAAPHLQPARAPLRRAIAALSGSPHDVQNRFPMERAVEAIEGSTAYYRWPDKVPSPSAWRQPLLLLRALRAPEQTEATVWIPLREDHLPFRSIQGAPSVHAALQGAAYAGSELRMPGCAVLRRQ